MLDTTASMGSVRQPGHDKPSLVGLSRTELATALVGIGIPERQAKMRVAQLWHWLYIRGATDFDAMTNVSKDLRAELARHFVLSRPEIVTEQVSDDGTRKWLLRFPPRGAGRPVEVETVYIPEEGRGTLCVSSQVGCTLSCSFCHTGTQKLVRNLTPEEIVGQILIARDRLGDYPGHSAEEGVAAPSTGRLVSNVVMMGMGEPLYNFDNVKAALLIAADGDGIALSRRRITLSTSGVVPMIARTGDEIGVMLAISLHAVRDELRNELVPLNKKYPIKPSCSTACRAYPGLVELAPHHLRIRDAEGRQRFARRRSSELVRLLKGIPAKINLIPFNPWPGTNYECSDWEQNRSASPSTFSTAPAIRLAGAHPARPRHPRRLRAAEERERAASHPRAHGARGDDQRLRRRS
jgi:23S rRNA (adenine2503-C2)-methyltransferase